MRKCVLNEPGSPSKAEFQAGAAPPSRPRPGCRLLSTWNLPHVTSRLGIHSCFTPSLPAAPPRAGQAPWESHPLALALPSSQGGIPSGSSWALQRLLLEVIPETSAPIPGGTQQVQPWKNSSTGEGHHGSAWREEELWERGKQQRETRKVQAEKTAGRFGDLT